MHSSNHLLRHTTRAVRCTSAFLLLPQLFGYRARRLDLDGLAGGSGRPVGQHEEGVQGEDGGRAAQAQRRIVSVPVHGKRVDVQEVAARHRQAADDARIPGDRGSWQPLNSHATKSLSAQEVLPRQPQLIGLPLLPD
jgi:hypothetical protein